MNDSLKAQHQRITLEIKDLETECVQISEIIAFYITGGIDSDTLSKISILQRKVEELAQKRNFLMGIEMATKLIQLPDKE